MPKRPASSDPYADIAKPIVSQSDPYADIAQPLATDNKSDPSVTGIISRQPSGIRPWLNSLEQDVRHGGTATAPGRLLKRMGATGTESGGVGTAGETVASVPLGLIKTAQGVAETRDHPILGPVKAVSGLLQTATLPMAFAGGPVANKAINAIPSKNWAGKMFQSVMGDAANVPVTLQHSGNAALRVKELSEAGTSMPQAVGKLLQRVTNPSKGPLTYAEARDFYSNITRLSGEEVNRLNPIMKRQLGIVTEALKRDIGDAAAQVGRAGDYYAAMKDYARASQMQHAAGKILKYIAYPVAAAAVGQSAHMGWNMATKK
jgi:hypothetical protein